MYISTNSANRNVFTESVSVDWRISQVV